MSAIVFRAECKSRFDTSNAFQAEDYIDLTGATRKGLMRTRADNQNGKALSPTESQRRKISIAMATPCWYLIFLEIFVKTDILFIVYAASRRENNTANKPEAS